MGWIKVIAQKSTVDRQLRDLGVTPNPGEYSWVKTGILSEDIDEFWELEPGHLNLTFLNGKPDMYIKETFEAFKDLMNAQMVIEFFVDPDVKNNSDEPS